ncbi:hypothetical protein BMF35_a1531 [Aurantiacibacter gangjinensis]|nr:hypothetical protein BMF35_a1531 [Aurantiacibacter gangjinensis]
MALRPRGTHYRKFDHAALGSGGSHCNRQFPLSLQSVRNSNKRPKWPLFTTVERRSGSKR